MTIEHIIFDNDGTLYKLPHQFKETVVWNMLSFLSKKLYLPMKKVEEERERLIQKYGVESTEYVFDREYNIDYDEFVNNTYLSLSLEDHGIWYDKRLITTLQDISQPKSILTNNPSEFAIRIQESLGVSQYFGYVIGSRELDHRLKPDKEAFKKSIEITGANPETTMFVDDVPKYHPPAKELGMTTVLVGTSSTEYKAFIDYEIEKLYELKHLIGGK